MNHELIDLVARVCAEYPAEWEWPGNVEPRSVAKYRAMAITIIAVCAARGGVSPVPMRITCPECGELHIDEGEFATKVHHTHTCQACGWIWRPAVVPTVGVRFLPGFKNDGPSNG